MIAVIVSALCAMVVLTRVICTAAHLKADGWPRWRFLAFSVSYAGFGASVFGLVVHLPGADVALLMSLAGVILFDRRQSRAGG